MTMNADSNDQTAARLRKANLNVVMGLLAGLLLGLGLGRASTQWFRETATADTNPTVPEYATAPVVEIDTAGRPARGPANAPVTIVEFTDYECPFCGQYARQIYPTLIAEYGDRVRYVVRNLPIGSLHPNAVKAAEAAECAAVQGRFWEYHDRLFERQALGLDEERLKRHATEVGLDGDRFSECLDSGAMEEVVFKDLADAARHGLSGTPTFFINGRKLVGAQPFSVFQSFIEEAIQDTTAASSGHVSR